jgi:multiple antibiotic resistance protein
VSSFYSYFVIALSTLFTIVNPLGAVGPFLAMTTDYGRDRRRATAHRSGIVCFGVLIGCSVLGDFVFRFFGITLPALRVAGGILLFFVALDMLNARPSGVKGTSEEAQEGSSKEDVAVFPLGIPLLSGPGAIVSVFILSEKASSVAQHTALYAAIFVTAALSALMLSEANRLAIFMGQIGINVMSRLLGLVLAAVAVQFIIDGLKQALPHLAS